MFVLTVPVLTVFVFTGAGLFAGARSFAGAGVKPELAGAWFAPETAGFFPPFTVNDAVAVTLTPLGAVPVPVVVSAKEPACSSALEVVEVAVQVSFAPGDSTVPAQERPTTPGFSSVSVTELRVTLPVFVRKEVRSMVCPAAV